MRVAKSRSGKGNTADTSKNRQPGLAHTIDERTADDLRVLQHNRCILIHPSSIGVGIPWATNDHFQPTVTPQHSNHAEDLVLQTNVQNLQHMAKNDVGDATLRSNQYITPVGVTCGAPYSTYNNWQQSPDSTGGSMRSR